MVAGLLLPQFSHLHELGACAKNYKAKYESTATGQLSQTGKKS